MSELKPAFREWALYLGKLIPGSLQVTRYFDEDNAIFVDIFTSRSEKGVVASTIGVMDFDLSRNPKFSLFTEILMDARGTISIVENVLSTIAFYIMKNSWQPAPGVIFESMVSMYDADSRVPHVIFLPPFQWASGMTKVELNDKTVYPLLAVPITESEKEYVRQNGADALFNHWDSLKLDIFDWNRGSH